MKFLLLVILALTTGAVCATEKLEIVELTTWHLGMNLNPSDGHIMDYTTGWVDDEFIGTYAEALSKDFLNRVVWRHPVNYIAIVRHQAGEVDAVKVFRFKRPSRSLLDRFREMNPGRRVVTEGGPLQETVSSNAQHLEDDPVFSVGGDLAFNWAYTDNGHRNPIMLQGTDHGEGWRFKSGPVYGNYAIYVSEDATTFPGPGYKLYIGEHYLRTDSYK